MTTNHNTTSNTSITTLEGAELAIRRAGIVQNETVEGKQLLDICGFTNKNTKEQLDRQIERHEFLEGRDFTASMQQSSGGRPKTVYHFTINAAKKLLLASKSQLRPVKVREEAALATIEQLLGITLDRQKSVGNYRLDGYHAESNTAYEIDEGQHFIGGELRKECRERQAYIEKELGCKFVRIKV